MDTIVGLIGVGRMGLPVASNLVRAGFEVIASDCRPERAAATGVAGATWKAGTAEVAAAADVLLTVLPGGAELRDAMSVAMPRLRAGATWIDLTSSSPSIGEELCEQGLARGVQVLDAPMGGGVHAALSATLQLFVGGRTQVVEQHRPLLEALGTISHMGDSGSGYTTKLLVNLLWFGQAVATGEALLVARRSGIDLDVLRQALARSSAASEFIRRDLGSLLDGDYLRTFGLDRCSEELEAITARAGELEVPFELSESVAQAYARALQRYGPIDGELLAVALLEERAGTRLRRDG